MQYIPYIKPAWEAASGMVKRLRSWGGGRAAKRQRTMYRHALRPPYRTGGSIRFRSKGLWQRHHVSKKVEKKYYDYTTSADYVSTTGTQWFMNSIEQGTGDTNRIGKRIEIVSLQGRFNIVPPADGTGDQIRIMIVVDHQCNGAAMTATDLLANPTKPMESHRNLNNSDRFTVLYDKTFTVQCINGKSQAETPLIGNHVIRMYKKCRVHPVYNGTGGLIANVNSNSINMWAWGHQATEQGDTTKAIIANQCWRIRFYDA